MRTRVRGGADAGGRAPARYLVVRRGPLSVRIPRRGLRAAGILVLVLFGCAAIALMTGDYAQSAGDVLRALVGAGADPLAQYFVQEQRLPRIVAAIGVGCALGMSGAIFQSLSGNPLGSPDVIGFTTGAATGAVLQIVLFDAGPTAIALGAVVGGFGTALVVYVLAWRGGLSGFRLVLVGIGVSAVLQGINSLLVVRASLEAGQLAAQWLAGSFNATTWAETALLLLALLVLVPVALVLAAPLHVMATGDDLATGLGVRVERRRLELVAVGVALVSLATATAGPIAFVALAAPQLARRIARSTGAGVGIAGIMGAVIVLGGDIVAQRLFAPVQLPVGVVTGALGGIYLVWLLAREGRRITV